MITIEYFISPHSLKQWTKNGVMDRNNDQPSVIWPDGGLEWYKDGRLHRDNDLPAVETKDGFKLWYQKGNKYVFQ